MTWVNREPEEGQRVRLLRELLKFEAGGVSVTRRRTKTTPSLLRNSGFRAKGRSRAVVDDEQSVNIMDAI